MNDLHAGAGDVDSLDSIEELAAAFEQKVAVMVMAAEALLRRNPAPTDPTGVITGDSFNISYSWPGDPWSAETCVRIDGTDTVLQDTAPSAGPTDLNPLLNETTWVVGDIEVKQRLSIVTGTSTGRADTGQYTYVWKTEKGWAGSCRQMVTVYQDGTLRSALFKFTK